MTDRAPPRPVRVLVVDDSASNRRTIADILTAHPDVEICGKAADGEEALQLAISLEPDVVTLDLEMPRMDGFTFLRILMARRPTPVIVVSSYAHKENVFKALELGALDFIAKPSRLSNADRDRLRDELLEKLKIVRMLEPAVLKARPTRTRVNTGSFPLERPDRTGQIATGGATPAPSPTPLPGRSAPPLELRHVVLIGSSTGGPTALLEIFAKLKDRVPAAIVIAQHMPEPFTRTFADRLSRQGAFRCVEAEDGNLLVAGTGYVCPGRSCIEVVARPGGPTIRLAPGDPHDRYVPSVARLFRSASQLTGFSVTAVVLTGMGDDGASALADVKRAGATVVAESEKTALIYGMPAAAVRTGHVDRVLPLPALADYLAETISA